MTLEKLLVNDGVLDDLRVGKGNKNNLRIRTEQLEELDKPRAGESEDSIGSKSGKRSRWRRREHKLCIRGFLQPSARP